MPNQWITLAIAILGVLHGPLGADLIAWLKANTRRKP